MFSVIRSPQTDPSSAESSRNCNPNRSIQSPECTTLIEKDQARQCEVMLSCLMDNTEMIPSNELQKHFGSFCMWPYCQM